MNQKKEIKDILEGLDQTINPLDKQTRQSDRQSSMLFQKFSLMLPIILLLVSGLYFLAQPLTNQQLNKTKLVADTSKEEPIYMQQLRGAKQKATFDWTVQIFDEITIPNEAKQSISLKDFTGKYGMADEVERIHSADSQSDLVSLTYNGQELQKAVFRFKLIDETYYLYSKNQYDLPDDRYPMATDDTFQFLWTKEKVEQLASTITPDEVIENYGPPTRVFQTSFDSFRQLTLIYQRDNDPDSTINSVVINFVADEAGDYVFSSKEGVFRD